MAYANATSRRIVQNFHLVWLDSSIDETNNDDSRNSITKLREVVNTVNTFADVDECIRFIDSIKEEKAFMIFSGALGETTVPIIHEKAQVNTIYIFCQNRARHEKWSKSWHKIQGVYTDITPICIALKEAAKDCDQNSISISFVKKPDGTAQQNLDTLDNSFMYTQILKEILLTIDFKQVHINEFLTYCREQFVGNNIELQNVDKIEREYSHHQPIWWYTYNCFLYSMLNRTLRLMEVDLIIKLGFFLKDLHNDIQALHLKQFGEHQHSNSFFVYRGQGLSQLDFDKLQQTQGGLLSFNNFLSTSTNRDVSLSFARRTMNTSDLIGILFVMRIDPNTTNTPFANVKDVSYYKGEEEILFSMHSVFRIEEIKQIDGNKRLWQVDLTLTNDNDPELHALTEHIRKATFPQLKGWHRLGELLLKLGQFNKAQQVFETLLDQAMSEEDKADVYHRLGMVKRKQGKYSEAAEYYEKSIKINEKRLPPTHFDLAASYSNLGLVYDSMGQYSKALSYHEKTREILEKILPPYHASLATCYNNIGLVCNNMKEYPKALSFYEKALAIYQRTLPTYHPHLSTCYSNIGLVYNNRDEYSNALLYFNKAFEIDQKILPPNHPDLAASYKHIGQVYSHLGDYSKALSYYQHALDIWQVALPSDHPFIKVVKDSIEIVKKKL